MLAVHLIGHGGEGIEGLSLQVGPHLVLQLVGVGTWAAKEWQGGSHIISDKYINGYQSPPLHFYCAYSTRIPPRRQLNTPFPKRAVQSPSEVDFIAHIHLNFTPHLI